ncbi:MAG: cytochrome P450 [Deltaproteobacteria bacterium]|nr:MAG: cytochrome P450 [Deltaproteobacteria bacterium]
MKGDVKGKHLKHIPGEVGYPYLGNFPRILRDPDGFDQRMVETYGTCFRNRTFHRTSVCLASADHNTEVLLDREQNFSSQNGWGHLIGDLFPRGLMLRDFDDHRKHRRIMQDAFRPSALKGYHEKLQQETLTTLKAWEQEASFLFYPALKRALFEQAATVFLGVPLGERAEELSNAFYAVLQATITPFRLNVPGTAWHRGLQGRKTLEHFIQSELEGRRDSDAKDVFTLLCKAEDEEGNRFDDSEIVDHMIFLLMAAHDTTSTGLTTLVQELVFQPEWQDRLREECTQVSASNDDLPWESLAELQQSDWAFREALRLNPPVRYVLRRTVRPTELGGYEVPENTPIALLLGATHKDPDIWSEPDTFAPDRFSPERGEDKQHKHGWAPFGGGAHTCIGIKFAMQQAKGFVYHLLSRYEMVATGEKKRDWQLLPFPRPKDDLPIMLKPLS